LPTRFDANSGREDVMVFNSPNDAYVHCLFVFFSMVLILLPLHHLGRALDFAKEIDDFVGCNHDLRALELDANDWATISQVAGWLKLFQSATTEMSRTKEPMLSTVLAIFRGLQDHVSSILRELPDSAPPQLRTGLVEAHRKLSEYYFRSDESPYYTWAACKYSLKHA
jgi:hypothetical protein